MPVPGGAAPPRSQRSLMVWEQLVQRGIRDQRVLDAMGEVPRECFVPEALVPMAYQDRALGIGHDQTISQPYMVALTLQALALDESHRVLEVGTGSGYLTALLALLCREVISVELVEDLAREAARRLETLGLSNVRLVVGDGSRGYPPLAPYHRIAVSAAAPEAPPSLVDQLDEGGVLVLPVGERKRQVLKRVVRRQGQVQDEDLCACVFVPLLGEEGWSAEEGAPEQERGADGEHAAGEERVRGGEGLTGADR